MNLRALLILAGAAVVLAVLAFVGQQRSSTGSLSETGTPLFPDLRAALDEVERVRLTGPGDEAVATLERTQESWTVAERDGYRADFPRVRQALVDLAEARIIERKTDDPAYYDRLGVEPIENESAGGTAVEIETADSAFPVLIAGEPESTSFRYGRFADESESFLFDRNPELPRDTAQWLDPEILDVRGARVEEVTIRHPDGETLRIFKDDPEQANYSVANVPPERELSYPGVANVTGNALRELRLEDVAAGTVDPEGAVTAEFRTFDGLIVTARGIERDGEGWLSFEASVAEAADAGTAGEDDTDDADGAVPSAEAAAINARVAGWRYRIPSHQYDQITRRMSDLLRPEE